MPLRVTVDVVPSRLRSFAPPALLSPRPEFPLVPGLLALMQPNHGVVVDGVAIELPAMPVATAPSAPPPSDAIDAIPIAPVLHHVRSHPPRSRRRP